MVSILSLVARLPALVLASLLALALARAAPPETASTVGTPPALIAVPTVLVGSSAPGPGFQIEGVLQARQQSTVSAQVSGRVLVLAVKAGDRVKAGQVLLRIDDRELQANLAAGEAAVAQAQAALLQAEQNAQRTRDLRTQGFVSAAALDTAQAQLKAAQAALQQAQAGRSQAGLARGFATVGAPFDGVVQATLVDVGDLASPGRPLLTLYAPGRLRAVVQLPASRAAAARAALLVELTLPDGRRLAPTSRTELPGTDAVSQTIEWRLDLPDSAAAAGPLQPGQPVQVRFAGAPADAPPDATAGASTGISIPYSAVLQRGELSAVYAAQGGRFVLKAVRLGPRQGDSVPVLAGLKAGERIATDPVRAGLAGATPQLR
jgi:RND family efflux transporter MFP subunit